MFTDTVLRPSRKEKPFFLSFFLGRVWSRHGWALLLQVLLGESLNFKGKNETALHLMTQIPWYYFVVCMGQRRTGRMDSWAPEGTAHQGTRRVWMDGRVGGVRGPKTPSAPAPRALSVRPQCGLYQGAGFVLRKWRGRDGKWCRK